MTSSATSKPQKLIVIIGGSYGGVSVAHNLLKHAVPKFPEPASYQVVLISTSSEAMCRPACPRALISDDMFPQEKLFTNIPKAFEQYPSANFRFIHGTATKLDYNSRSVTVTTTASKDETIHYYALVVATGATTPSPLLSLTSDEQFLRASWRQFREALPSTKTIVIAGGGPAGIETAGELGEYLNGRSGWLQSESIQPKVSITVITSASNILPALRPAIVKQAESYLAGVGVKIIKNTRVKSVAPEGAGTTNITAKASITIDNDSTLEADLYIPATGTTPNTTFISPALLTSDHRIETNPTTLRVDKASPRVYALGDVSSASRPAIHLLLEAIPIASSNIMRDILLDIASNTDDDNDNPKTSSQKIEPPSERHFKEDTRETQMVPIGKNKGVGAAMGWKLPSFLVWAIKGRDYWLWTTGPLWSGKQWSKPF